MSKHCCFCGEKVENKSLTRKNLANNVIMLSAMKTYTAAEPHLLRICYAENVKTRKYTCIKHFLDAAQYLLADILKYGGSLSKAKNGTFFVNAGVVPVSIAKKLNCAARSIADDIVIPSSGIKDYVNSHLELYYGDKGWKSLQGDLENKQEEKPSHLEALMEVDSTPERLEQTEYVEFTPPKVKRVDSGSTYKPPSSSWYSPEKQLCESMVESENLIELDETDPSLLNKFYLVQGKKLLELFHLSRCQCARTVTEGVRLIEYGSAPVIEYVTLGREPEKRRWEGQDKVTPSPKDKLFSGNAQTCVAAITTGLRMTNLLHWAREACVALPSRTTFYNIFADIRPHIESVYAKYQERAIQQIKASYEIDGRPTGWNIAVDGAYDSRGFSAEFCKVLAVDLKTKLCIHTEVVHRSETGASGSMEKEGFRRMLHWLESKEIPIRSISTDRSNSYGCAINLYNKESGRKITWLLDPWHLARYLDKNLRTIAKQKDCAPLKSWIGDLKTHLYHAIKKGAEAHSGSLIRDTFNCCLHHVAGEHEWSEDPTTGAIRKCAHGTGEGGEKKPTIAIGTAAHEKLRKVVLQREFQKHLTLASPFGGTSRCETKNALDRLYCPKEIYLPRITYPLYAKMATLHLNALRSAEISGERTVIRRCAIHRKHRDKQSFILYKTPIEHLWRSEIYASYVSRRMDRLWDDEKMDNT